MPAKRISRVKFNSHRIAERDTRILFAGNPLPMWIYDVTPLRVLEVNDSAVRQYGYTREEFLSLTINDIRPQREVPTDQDPLSGSGGDSDKVWVNVKKDGTQIYVKI